MPSKVKEEPVAFTYRPEMEDVNKNWELPAEIKEEPPKQGTTMEDIHRTLELPDEAKEELQKQGTALPEERTMVGKSLKATKQLKVFAKKQPPTLPPVGTKTCPAVEGGARTQVTHPPLMALELNPTDPLLACP